MEERSYNQGVTVSADGITVHQLYTEDEFDIPSVVLKLVSNRTERTRVQLTVTDIDVDRIGFHPEFEQESWTLGADTLQFETELAPESELTTLYAVEAADGAVVGRALESLRIADVVALESEPPRPSRGPSESDQTDLDGETADSLESSGFEAPDVGDDSPANSDESADTEVAEFTDEPDDILLDPDELGDGVSFEPAETEEPTDSIASTELSEESPDTDETPEAVDTGENVEANMSDNSPVDDEPLVDTETFQESTEMNTNEQEERKEPSLSTDELVAELLDRLEEGELSTEQRQQLAAEFGESDREGVYDAKIGHLQSRMSDIETFTKSMETVFEQHGQPATVFGEFEERLGRIEAELSEVSAQAEATAEWRDTVEPRLDSVEEGVEDVAEDASEVTEAVEEIETEVDELQTWREKVTGALKTFMD